VSTSLKCGSQLVELSVNRSGAKGTLGETAVVRCLRPLYPMAERRAKQGNKDKGDIGGVCPRLVVEVKHCPKRYEISEWLKEADREGVNDSAELSVVWFKLKGTIDPLDWPVMMRGRFFLKLLALWTATQETTASDDDGSEQLSLF
jgi:hypothetical protein